MRRHPLCCSFSSDPYKRICSGSDKDFLSTPRRCLTFVIESVRAYIFHILQVSTLLLTPICPHVCDYVWRNVLRKPSSALTVGWPQTAEPDASLMRQVKLLSSPPVLHPSSRMKNGGRGVGASLVRYFHVARFHKLKLQRILMKVLAASTVCGGFRKAFYNNR